MTFSCWLYKEDKTSVNAFYSCHEGTSNRYIYNINDNNTFRFYYSGDKFKSTFDFLGKWIHFAVTRNGGTFIFYINGYRIRHNIISGYSNPSTMGSYVYTSNTRFSLGQEWDSSASDFYKGKMKNVHFWASTLTDSNIEELYLNERPNPIRLGGFRGISKGSVSVPSSGSISINSHFKGKTFEGSSIIVAPTLSVSTQTSWNYSGSGTSSDPYDGSSTNAGSHGSTARLIWQVSGNGYVYIYSNVSSEGAYDYGHIYLNGTQIWKKSGNYTYNYTKHSVSNGYTIEFKYTKDGSVNSGSDRQNMKIYTSAT